LWGGGGGICRRLGRNFCLAGPDHRRLRGTDGEYSFIFCLNLLKN
jgi:hypothetical protein